MVRRSLRGMTQEQLEQWSLGRPIAEVVEELGGIGEGQAVLVAPVPKNGNFNRCSVCRTALTSAKMLARPMLITTPDDVEWHAMVIICSPSCGRRLV